MSKKTFLYVCLWLYAVKLLIGIPNLPFWFILPIIGQLSSLIEPWTKMVNWAHLSRFFLPKKHVLCISAGFFSPSVVFYGYYINFYKWKCGFWPKITISDENTQSDWTTNLNGQFDPRFKSFLTPKNTFYEFELGSSVKVW